MTDEDQPRIYVEGEYTRGKLVHKEYVLEDSGIAFTRNREVYASLPDLVKDSIVQQGYDVDGMAFRQDVSCTMNWKTWEKLGLKESRREEKI